MQEYCVPKIQHFPIRHVTMNEKYGKKEERDET